MFELIFEIMSVMVIGTLKGPSHQIRFAWKWYGSLGLG